MYIGILSILIGAHEFSSEINIFWANCVFNLVQNEFDFGAVFN